MGKKVALYGGSFDPIHHGHLIVARAVAEKLGIDRVILLPASGPPHKPAAAMAPARDRAYMVRAAIDGEPLFELRDYDLSRRGPNFTIDTVAHFRKELGDEIELYWIIGADSLAELPSWHKVENLVDACHIITARRPSADTMDWERLRLALGEDRVEKLRGGLVASPAIEISSSDVRNRLRLGRSVRYMVPDAVHKFIKDHNLYKSVAP